MKIVRFLPIALSIAALGVAADNFTQYSVASDNRNSFDGVNRKNSEDQESPRSNSRWIKDPASRKEYLKGHENFQKFQGSSKEQIADLDQENRSEKD